jgi:N-acetylmuramoyl-L-alanine amidase
MTEHIVRQGDSIISLSKQYGVPASKIWNHPDNSQLRESGRKESILFPGDRVTIPERETKQVEAATGQRHHFRCNGRTSWIRLRYLRNGEPREAEPYLLMVEGQEFSGNLDSDGRLEVRVPADAREGIVFLGEPENRERFDIQIGYLDPIHEDRGIRQRLQNLGFSCGNEDSLSAPRTRAALRRFQTKNDLEVTGEIDEATRSKLIELHGS